MDAKEFFNAEEYFSSLCNRNKLAQDKGFRFGTCSGIESLQDMLDNFRRQGSFFSLDDTNDGSMIRGRAGGFYKQRTFTVFILRRYKFNDETDRAEQLAVCRRVFRQVLSRMLVDSKNLQNKLIYLKTDNVVSREMGQYFINGCTGLYFMIDVSEPVDLRYDDSEWLS